MQKNIVGWALLRRKAARKRVWRVLNIMVAIATIANVSAIGLAFKPKVALAAPASIWTTRTTCINPEPQDENEYSNGEWVHVRGSNFEANTTYYGTVSGQPGGASADPGEIVKEFQSTTDAAGYFCVAAYLVGSDGDLDDGVYTVDVYDNPNYQGSSKNDNYHVNAKVGSLTVNKIVDSGDASADSFVFEITPDPYGMNPFSTSGGSILINNLPVGNYTVEEVNGPDGYHMVSNDCDVDVVNGGNVSCTVHNARDMGTVHVFKQVRNVYGFWWEPRADELWSWTIAGDATEYHWGDSAQVETNVEQTITEDPNDFPAPGYATEWSCYEGESFFSSGAGRSLDFALTKDGQEIVCTFYNMELGDIHGQKWSDANGDGVWDQGEIPLNGWQINLYQEGQLIDSMVTQNHDNQDGWYWFENLEAGTYNICEVPQGGWNQTYPLNDNGNCHTIVIGGSEIDREDPSTCNSQETLNAVLAPSCNFGNQKIPGEPDLSIEKSNNITTFVNPGATVQYTIVVTNNGDGVAEDVVLTDVMPDGFSYVAGSSTPDVDTVVGQVMTWNLGDIPAGDDVTVVYSATVSATQAAGTYTNTATAGGENTDEVSDTSDVEVRVPVVLGEETDPALELSKSVNPTVTNPGKTVTYTLVVKSVGTEDAMNVIVTDTLPPGFTYQDGTSSKSWTFATIAMGEQETITVDVNVGAHVTAGNYANTAVALADEVSPVTAEAVVEVRVPKVLGLATTGVGLRDYLVFSLGLALTAAGFVGVRRFSLVTRKPN